RLIMQVSGHSRMPCRLRNRLSILVKRAMCAVNGVVSHGRASCGEKILMSGFGCSSPKIGDRVMRKDALAALLGLSLAATTVAAVPAQAKPTSPQLAKLVKLKNVRHHQKNLQKIADANGGNRAAGLPGSEITVKYIADQLRRAGYKPKIQDFTFDFWQELSEPVFEQIAPEQRAFTPGDDFATMQYSGAGDVTAAATPV